MSDETPAKETESSETSGAELPAAEAEQAVVTQAVAATAPSDEPLFEEDELRQFDADDVEAGSAICKMLSLFFLYTVIVMAIAGAWTAAVMD